METKFTNGKLNYFRSSYGHMAIESEKGKIADVYSPEDSEENEDLANAALFTAAPDLFNALVELMKGVESLPPLSAISGVLEKQYKQAEEAIKKAITL